MDTSEWISLGALIVSIVAAYIAYRANSVARNQNMTGQWRVVADDQNAIILIQNISPIRMSKIKIAVTVSSTSTTESYYKNMRILKRCKPGDTILFQIELGKVSPSILNSPSIEAAVSIESTGKAGIRYLAESAIDITKMAPKTPVKVWWRSPE